MMLEVNMGMGLELGLTAGLGMVLDMVLQKKKGLVVEILYTRAYTAREIARLMRCALTAPPPNGRHHGRCSPSTTVLALPLRSL